MENQKVEQEEKVVVWLGCTSGCGQPDGIFLNMVSFLQSSCCRSLLNSAVSEISEGWWTQPRPSMKGYR
jgi:hypothetical protein